MPSNTLSKRERERRESQRHASPASKRFLRLPAVMELTGLRHTTIYKLISENRFPKQVRVGDRAVAWLEDEIIEYQNARIAERDATDAAA
jgi:prophage regulatory protein